MKLVKRASSEFSAAAADALELAVQQLVSFVRRRIHIGVVAVATIACELRSVHAVATEAAARSVTAACIGRERRYRQKCQPQTGGEKFVSLHHASRIAPCKAESGQPRHTTESGI
jgi:hypothetical protein